MVVLSNYCMGSIQALLSAPNPDDPLAENIAKHWKTNEAEAVATGKFLGWFAEIWALNVERLWLRKIWICVGSAVE